MPKYSISKNQRKKRLDAADDESAHVSTEIDWSNTGIVFVEKNGGSCYSTQMVYTQAVNKDGKILTGHTAVAFSRGRGAHSILTRTRSRLGLVSISPFKLANACTAVLEEMVTEDHLRAYLDAKIIDREIYKSLLVKMGATSADAVEEENAGYVFEEGNGEDGKEDGDENAAAGGGGGGGGGGGDTVPKPKEVVEKKLKVKRVDKTGSRKERTGVEDDGDVNVDDL
jgi:hypothetical protein